MALVLALQGYVADHSEGKSSQQDQMGSWLALLPLGSSLVFFFFSGFWLVLQELQKTKSFATFCEGDSVRVWDDSAIRLYAPLNLSKRPYRDLVWIGGSIQQPGIL